MRPAHQSCGPETGRLHVQSFAPIISMSSLGECALVAVNKRDVHRVEQATSEVKPQYARCTVSSLTCIHVFQYKYLRACSWTLRGWRSVFVSAMESFNACHAIEIRRVSPQQHSLAGSVKQSGWIQLILRKRFNNVNDTWHGPSFRI